MYICCNENLKKPYFCSFVEMAELLDSISCQIHEIGLKIKREECSIVGKCDC